MPLRPTHQQVEYLRNLGFARPESLDREQAEATIKKLLAEEERSGNVKLACPTCGTPIGTRPKQPQTPCKNCGKVIYQINGKLYNAEQKNEYELTMSQYRRRWMQNKREQFVRKIRELEANNQKLRSDKSATPEQRRARTVVGIRVKMGSACRGRGIDGREYTLVQVNKDPNLLPPYTSCVEDDCDCTVAFLTESTALSIRGGLPSVGGNDFKTIALKIGMMLVSGLGAVLKYGVKTAGSLTKAIIYLALLLVVIVVFLVALREFLPKEIKDKIPDVGISRETDVDDK